MKLTVTTWNMQGAGKDPARLLCEALDRTGRAAAEFRADRAVICLQECGSPETLASAICYEDLRLTGEVGAINEFYDLGQYLLFDGRNGEAVRFYTLLIVWRRQDSALRCGTGILTEGEELAWELKDACLRNSPWRAIAETRTAFADGNSEEIPAAKGKIPRPLVGLELGGVWVYSMHAIANSRIAFSQTEETVERLFSEKGGTPFLIGGDFNHGNPSEEKARQCNSVWVMPETPTQGAGGKRVNRLDYFLCPAGTRIERVTAESVLYNEDEPDCLSDHDIVIGCFELGG